MRDRSMIVMPESGPACAMRPNPPGAGTPSIARTGAGSQSRSAARGGGNGDYVRTASVSAACGRDARGPKRWRTASLVAFALEAFAQHLAMPADRLGLFAGAPFRRLFIRAAPLHLA